MLESITLFLDRYLSPELVIFLISMLPILELRMGLVAAALLDVPVLPATAICVIGNILPIPIILLFVKKVLLFLRSHGPIKRLAAKFINIAMTKGGEIMKKYPRQVQLGLFLFVAIPLPGTGAWTGSLIAAFLGIDLRKAFPPICLGVLGAGTSMLVITYFVPWLITL